MKYLLTGISVLFIVSFPLASAISQENLQDKNNIEVRKILGSLSDLKRYIRQQCDWCADGLLADESAGQLKEFTEVVGSIVEPALNTPTWDYDFELKEIRFVSESRAIVSLRCYFYREMEPTKRDLRSSNLQVIEFNKMGGRWMIVGMKDVILFLKDRGGGSKDDTEIQKMKVDRE
jgi:hypothetical protein